MIKDSQFKKLGKVLARAQLENAQLKKEKIEERKNYIKGTAEYEKITSEIGQIRTISDGTKETYSDTMKAVLREAERQFGVTEWKHLKQEHTEKIIQDKIARGESAQNIRKVIHSLDYFQSHATVTRVFKEKHIDVTDHKKNLKMLKDNKIIRKSEDSHRYRATKDECLAVIKEMEKYDKTLADMARYQLLTGFRVSEVIRQKEEYVHLVSSKHESIKSKGGLDNIVHTNHHTNDEKAFVAALVSNPEPVTNRIFHRPKDEKGNYKSDTQVRQALTRLASRCAKRLGIGGGDSGTFSSHCFRGSFSNDRMKYYARHWYDIDQIIEDKIYEQPRLREKYKNFEKRIKDKVSESKRDEREIQLYEKIQWLVSTDLNHSRQDISRFYVSAKEIKMELAKYQ